MMSVINAVICAVSFRLSVIYGVSFMLKMLYAMCHSCCVSWILNAIYAKCHLQWVLCILSVIYAECPNLAHYSGCCGTWAYFPVFESNKNSSPIDRLYNYDYNCLGNQRNSFPFSCNWLFQWSWHTWVQFNTDLFTVTDELIYTKGRLEAVVIKMVIKK